MCLLNCAGANDHLHNSKTRPRSPFDRSNFVCLSSALRISGFHNNWMENRYRVVLKRCVNVIGRNACALAWLTKWTKVIRRRLLDNFRYNIRSRSTLKYVTLLFTKTTRIHSEGILIVSPEILHTERDELALLSASLFWWFYTVMDHYGLDRQTRHFTVTVNLMCCVTWSCKFFPCHMTHIAEPKLVNVTN